jgi:gliding motility-associated lipoprotein GldJ
MKMFRFSSLMLAVALLMASCGNKAGKSDVTGWNYNDPKWGGFDVSDRTNQGTAPGLVFIEGGSFMMGHSAEDTRYTWDNLSHTVDVSSFFMDETEVSNKHYNEFVYWMKRAYGEENPELVTAIIPDTAIWREKLAWRESFVDMYFQSPTYYDYPVVGVTWEQAQKFCRWRTDRVNEKLLVDMGAIELNQEGLGPDAFQTDVYLAGLYEGESEGGIPNLDPDFLGDNRNIRQADGILFPYYRLPTEAEWEYAARAQVGTTYDERQVEYKTYPWAGQSLRSANKRYYGQFMANFKRSRGDAMGVAGNLNDGWDYTCPVKWYFPNDYGLYNMAGNVSEWCADVYRKITTYEDEENDPFRGNVYVMAERDEDDQVKLNEDGTVSYVNVPDDMTRRNYRQADNINYLDGDYNSSLDKSQWSGLNNENNNEGEEGGDEEESEYADGEEEEEEEGTALEGNARFTNDMYKRLVGSGENPQTLVSDKSRVVKGGSWKDRAYYLQVGSRRFLDQDRCASWIGFRCAMDRLGSRVSDK